MKHSLGYEFLITILRQILDKPNEKVKSIIVEISKLRKAKVKSFY
jgi:hypothetical protein